MITKIEQNAPSRKKETIWSLPFVVLMCVNFFSLMSSFMTSTTIPIFASALGASVGIIGVIVGIFPFAALLVRPFAGPAFDSFSRKKLLIIVQCVACLCMFLYGLSDSLQMLCIVRFFHGMFMGCSGPLGMSLVSEFLPLRKFASGISVYALSNSCAQIVGPAVGLYLVDIFGFGPGYFFAGTLNVVSIIGLFFIREPHREYLKYELKLNRMFAKEAVRRAIPLMLLGMSFSCVGTYVVLYGYSAGVQDMGFYFVVYAVCLLATRPLFGNFADRVGSPKVIFAGIIFFAASFIVLSQARDIVGFIVAAVVGSAGFGCCAPLLQSMALGSVPDERRGAASNTTFTGVDLGILFGPIIGGLLVEIVNEATGSELIAYADMWLIMLIPIVMALCFVLYWIVDHWRKKKAPRRRSVSS